MRSDEALLKAHLGGEEQAFSEWARRHQDMLYRLAMRDLQDKHLAQEAVQEVFLRAWKKMALWQFGWGKPAHWLYKTLKNVCREMWRTRQKDQARHSWGDEAIAHSEAMQTVTPTESAYPLHHWISQLPPRQKEIMTLHVFEECKLKEVAGILNIPLGTVKSNYHKALTNLRHRYGHYRDHPEGAVSL